MIDNGDGRVIMMMGTTGACLWRFFGGALKGGIKYLRRHNSSAIINFMDIPTLILEALPTRNETFEKCITRSV